MLFSVEDFELTLDDPHVFNMCNMTPSNNWHFFLNNAKLWPLHCMFSWRSRKFLFLVIYWFYITWMIQKNIWITCTNKNKKLFTKRLNVVFHSINIYFIKIYVYYIQLSCLFHDKGCENRKFIKTSMWSLSKWTAVKTSNLLLIAHHLYCLNEIYVSHLINLSNTAPMQNWNSTDRETKYEAISFKRKREFSFRTSLYGTFFVYTSKMLRQRLYHELNKCLK